MPSSVETPPVEGKTDNDTQFSSAASAPHAVNTSSGYGHQEAINDRVRAVNLKEWSGLEELPMEYARRIADATLSLGEYEGFRISGQDARKMAINDVRAHIIGRYTLLNAPDNRELLNKLIEHVVFEGEKLLPQVELEWKAQHEQSRSAPPPAIKKQPSDIDNFLDSLIAQNPRGLISQFDVGGDGWKTLPWQEIGRGQAESRAEDKGATSERTTTGGFIGRVAKNTSDAIKRVSGLFRKILPAQEKDYVTGELNYATRDLPVARHQTSSHNLSGYTGNISQQPQKDGVQPVNNIEEQPTGGITIDTHPTVIMRQVPIGIYQSAQQAITSGTIQEKNIRPSPQVALRSYGLDMNEIGGTIGNECYKGGPFQPLSSVVKEQVGAVTAAVPLSALCEITPPGSDVAHNTPPGPLQGGKPKLFRKIKLIGF